MSVIITKTKTYIWKAPRAMYPELRNVTDVLNLLQFTRFSLGEMLCERFALCNLFNIFQLWGYPRLAAFLLWRRTNPPRTGIFFSFEAHDIFNRDNQKLVQWLLTQCVKYITEVGFSYIRLGSDICLLLRSWVSHGVQLWCQSLSRSWS